MSYPTEKRSVREPRALSEEIGIRGSSEENRDPQERGQVPRTRFLSVSILTCRAVARVSQGVILKAEDKWRALGAGTHLRCLFWATGLVQPGPHLCQLWLLAKDAAGDREKASCNKTSPCEPFRDS